MPQRLARLLVAVALIAIALPVSFPSKTAVATAANPALIKDVIDQRSEMYAFQSLGRSSYADGITIMGNTSVFAAMDPKYGDELFISDGTNAGTRLLRDIEN